MTSHAISVLGHIALGATVLGAIYFGVVALVGWDRQDLNVNDDETQP